jgi:hypothetical protein
MLIDLPKDKNPEPKKIPGKLCIQVSRVPYDDSLTIILPNGAEEYVLSDRAERLLRIHGVKDPEKIITHVWNFYSATLYVDDPAAGRDPRPTP